MSINRYFHQIMDKPQPVGEWTRIAHYLKDNSPGPYIYFLGPPDLYLNYGTLRFIAPNVYGENVLDPQLFLKKKVTRREAVTFVLVRSNRKYINQLRHLYPGGKLIHHKNKNGKNPFLTYEVNL